jgi:Cdc6-like AAA superfamily ATPase
MVDVLEVLGSTPHPLQITTKRDWRAYVQSVQRELPPTLSSEERRELSVRERRSYDRNRILYHLELPLIRYPRLNGLHAAAVRRVALNSRSGPGVRQGYAVLGDAGTGKTMLLLQIGRTLETHLRGRAKRSPTRGRNDWVPVVYITMPTPATPKTIAAKLVRFFEGQTKGRTVEQLTHQLKACVVGTKTIGILLTTCTSCALAPAKAGRTTTSSRA